MKKNKKNKKKPEVSTFNQIASELKSLAKDKEVSRKKLEVTAEKLAVAAKEKEDVRQKLEVTAAQLAVFAKEKEAVRKKLEVTAAKLAVFAKEKEAVRKKLEGSAAQLALFATEKEAVRSELAATAKEKEDVRQKLEVTAAQLAVTANKIESANKYARSLIEASLDPLVTISPKGKITDVNAATIKVTGVSRKNLIGTHFYRYFTEPKKALIARNKVFKEGSIRDFPLTIKSKEGKLTDVLYNAALYNDENGNVLGAFAAARDVTQAKKANELMESVRSKLAVIAKEKEDVRQKLEVTAAQLAVAATEKEAVRQELAVIAKEKEDVRQKLEVTAAQLALFATEKEAVRRELAATAKEKEDVRQKLEVTAAQLAVAATEKEAVRRELAATAKEKEDVRQKLEVTAAQLAVAATEKEAVRQELAVTAKEKEDARKELVEIAEEKEDARKKLEVTAEQLKLKDEQLVISTKEMEAFSYSVSHDLRAPLRAIDGFTQILVEKYDEKLDDEGKRITSIIRASTLQMGKLIDDLLSFSRLGRQEVKKSIIDTILLVNEIYKELRKASPKRDIEFVVGDLPVARADGDMLRQVWTNLLSNAIKFTGQTEKAKIEIGSTSDNSSITFYVKDNGAGFDMKYVNKLFGVFQRLHSVEEFEGTGVGLANVKRIIERHGGKVWAEGKVGEGATIYFSLPK